MGGCSQRVRSAPLTFCATCESMIATATHGAEGFGPQSWIYHDVLRQPSKGPFLLTAVCVCGYQPNVRCFPCHATAFHEKLCPAGG